MAIYSDQNLTYSDSNLRYNDEEGGSEPLPDIPEVKITYAEVDRETWYMQPQTVRQRVRYQGWRESESMNLEVNAFEFDVRRILEEIQMQSDMLDAQLDYLFEGVTYTNVKVTQNVDATLEVVSNVGSIKYREAVKYNRLGVNYQGNGA